MVNKKFLFLFLAIFLGLVSLNFISSAINVTECGELNQSEIYTLNQSINITGDAEDACIFIVNDSIILDCQGHTITINSSDESEMIAVGTQNQTNITVKNCVFAQNFTGPTGPDVGQDAISFTNSTNSTIFNNTFEVSGIRFESSINANISGNTINNSIGAAISLSSGSNSSVVENNNITTNRTGINVDESLNINISSNNITNSEPGLINVSMIHLEDADGSIIDDNTIITAGVEAIGISMGDVFNAIVDLNTIITSGVNSTALLLDDGTSDSNITSNNITTSGVGGNGISGMITPQSNLLFNNTITTIANESAGISLDEATDTNISSNTITTSGYHADGIRLQGSDDSIVTQNIVRTVHLDACVINIRMSGYNNSLYDNIFNTSSEGPGACLNEALDNIWNTTKTPGTNIIGGPNLGGNFWTNNASAGVSDLCLDSDGDYICDDPLSLATGNVDYLPLANHTNMISGCDTLNEANKTYSLNQSISSNGTCFNITANNITLNFANYSIIGNGTGYGINVSGNDTIIFGGSAKGVISNFSNGLYISSSSNNDFRYFYINNSVQDAILLEGNTSDNNNFTGISVINTNASCYDINFSIAGIDGTWIEDISGFENYTFTGAGGKVNFKEPSYGEIMFLEAINGSGTSLQSDVDIESNWAFVNGSKLGLNKSANIGLYSITFTDPKPQYSSDGTTYTDCTSTTDPACVEISYSASTDIYIFNVSHFTYFKTAEAYEEEEDDTPSSGGSSGLPEVKEIHSWTLITPGIPIIMKDFDSEIGIKQIQIEVHTEAQDVKITVTKHDGKPAEVAVEKSGKVYKYLQVETENLEDKLEKAVITIQVNRSWVSDNNIDENNITMFKFNESEEEWNELTTTYTESDDDYYYYEVELDEFSYFAISEKSVVGEGGEEEEGGISVWVWILVAVAIIAIIVWQMKTKKK